MAQLAGFAKRFATRIHARASLTAPPWRRYIEFLGLYTGIVGLSYLLLHNFEFYITLLGFAALGLEATLPLPQVIVNWDRKSTAGVRPLNLFARRSCHAFLTEF